MVLKPIRDGIVEASTLSCLSYKVINSRSIQRPPSAFNNRVGLPFLNSCPPLPSASPEDDRAFVINEHSPIGPLGFRLQPDFILNQMHIAGILLHQFMPLYSCLASNRIAALSLISSLELISMDRELAMSKGSLGKKMGGRWSFHIFKQGQRGG